MSDGDAAQERPTTTREQDEPPGERWRDLMRELRKAFPSPWREEGEDQVFENTFMQAVALLDRMKHPRIYEEQKAWQGYLGGPALPDYSRCTEARLDEEMRPLDLVIRELVAQFDGMPNWNHPQTMANVVPPANTASIIGALLGSIFSPNIVEGDYSWNVARTEIESGSILADMIGWDPETAGGLYTYGGSGCYLYGVKLALTTVLGRRTRFEGVRVDGQILVSAAGHFAKAANSDWSGLGMNNVRAIDVDDSNRMSVPHLQEVMADCKAKGQPAVMVVCTMGTTDAFAVDPIDEVRQVVDAFENCGGYPKPFIYADAVIGWSWTAFSSYDFRENPLRFSGPALRAIEDNYRQIRHIHHADAVGIDFHKTGWSPYACSFFAVKDYQRMVDLLSRPMPAYLQDRTPYNPFKFTLECSRSGSAALAGWATLRLFGRKGFQVMLGRIIEVGLSLRRLLDAEKNFVCVNPDNHGFVTLFRVYPKHVDAEAQYDRELHDPTHRDELEAYNKLQERVANKLFAMLRDPEQRVEGWENPPFTSFTSGFRAPSYDLDDLREGDRVAALKAYPMSPNSNELSMLLIRNYFLKARDLAIAEMLADDQQGGDEAYNWFGDNAPVPQEYLVPPARVSALDSLRMIPFCAHLAEAQFQRLAAGARTVRMKAGEVLFEEGAPADKVYLVLAGRVLVYKTAAGGDDIELATIDQGRFFGEMALFDRGRRAAAVRCLEPSEFLIIDGDAFLQEVLA